ncbi:MAG: hypothetical protein E5Y81_02345 [Mesorhizobium sp.]|nr:MAG: hypothetical protein E5Y81_02345 [Mesorhizobium sp.]
MADDPNEDAKPTETQREAQEALEKQVAQLKREINKINRTLAEHAEEVVEEATGWYEGAADSVSRTTQALRKRASTASGVAPAAMDRAESKPQAMLPQFVMSNALWKCGGSIHFSASQSISYRAEDA